MAAKRAEHRTLGMIGRILALLLLLWSASAAWAETRWTIARTLPHDKSAFTEGLFIADGEIYESTGLAGRSDIRVMSLKDGRILRRVATDPTLFGEGIVAWGDRLISLTWQAGRGFIWQRDSFKQIGTFRYAGEGWGLTSDGKRLIMSDGSATLRFLDPETLKQTGSLAVTWDGAPVKNLNELEYVHGEILANIWYSPLIARIDPKTGAVTDWINLAPLVAENIDGNLDSVLNGIAWDPKTDLVYVTGKNWPHLYALKLEK